VLEKENKCSPIGVRFVLGFNHRGICRDEARLVLWVTQHDVTSEPTLPNWQTKHFAIAEIAAIAATAPIG
jgi:hypothetical protein